jgi:hypothetical protein
MKRVKQVKSKNTFICHRPGCRKLLRNGELRKHDVDFHGADPRILTASRNKRAKGGRIMYSVTNIKRPWQGGAPGSGKRS